MNILRALSHYVSAVGVAGGHDPVALARQSARIVRARRRYGIGAHFYSLFGLAQVPETLWADYVLEVPFDRLQQRLNRPDARIIAFDKLAFNAHCARHDLPTVPILGIIDANPREAFAHLALPDARALGAFLEGHGEKLFFKRIDGSKGQGAFVVEHAPGGFRFGERVGSSAELFAACTDSRKIWVHGTTRYLIQPRIRIHPTLNAIMSPFGVGTMRAICTMIDGRPGFPFAFLKMTVGRAETDNVGHGTSSNLVAGIDMESGRLTWAARSRSAHWPDMVEVTHHPDTGQRIAGFPLPHWREAKALMHKAAASAPGIGLAGWDVPFTADGPLVLEVGVQASLDIIQLLARRGLRRELYAAIGGAIPPDEYARILALR
jgi:hypothetical protein